MVNPPKRGVNSDEVVDLHEKELEMIFGGLKKRSKIMTDALNKVPRITTNALEGAMYAFPRVHLTESAVRAAKEKGMAPDSMYCMEALNETGLVVVAGSGFGQRAGTYHFRITNLIYNTNEFEHALKAFKEFNNRFYERYP